MARPQCPVAGDANGNKKCRRQNQTASAKTRDLSIRHNNKTLCLICQKHLLTEHTERKSAESNSHGVSPFSVVRVAISKHSHSYNNNSHDGDTARKHAANGKTAPYRVPKGTFRNSPNTNTHNHCDVSVGSSTYAYILYISKRSKYKKEGNCRCATMENLYSPRALETIKHKACNTKQLSFH